MKSFIAVYIAGIFLIGVVALSGCRRSTEEPAAKKELSAVNPAPLDEDVRGPVVDPDAERQLSEAPARARREFAAAQDEVRQQSETIRRLQEEVQTSVKQRDEMTREIERLNELLKASEEKRDYAEDQLRQWNEFYEQYEAQVVEYRALIAGQNETISELRKQIGNQPEENPALKALTRLVPTNNRALSRSKFWSVIHGMSEDDLRAYLGQPNTIEGDDPKYFVYRKSLTYVSNEDEKDSGVCVVLKDGAVSTCAFLP